MISNYEKQYIGIVKDIIENGYYSNNRTGIPTYKLPHKIIQVDLSKEFPILQSKFVAFKTCVKEMLWIYQKQSNVVQDLRDVGVKVWNEWEIEDGTIGKAYGYQIKQYHQIDKLIDLCKNNIEASITSIENADFKINPKVIKDEYIGCKFCPYNDICYKTYADYVILEEQKDLEFLN